MVKAHSIFSLLFGVGSGLAFTSQNSAVKLPTRPGNLSSITSTSRRLTEDLIPQECLTARGDCVFWFFGASGAAGIARSAFPKMFEDYSVLQSLKGVGPTKGGEMMGINTFACGLPQDLSRADVEDVVNNPLSVDEMVRKFPVPENYMASLGYLSRTAFEQGNANANPLAVRAVFDTFATNTGMCDPFVAQAKLDKYKSNIDAVKFSLFKSKVVGLAAIITLLFLLGIADIIAFSDVYKGWFPDWPGGQNFPFSMFTEPNGSPFSIPDYWI